MGEETKRLRSAFLRVLLVLGGAVCAFGLTVFVPPIAFGANIGLIVALLVRRRMDAYGWFTVGFAIWCAVYVSLAVFAAFGVGSSSDSTGYESGSRP